jgi:hypothetical protein
VGTSTASRPSFRSRASSCAGSVCRAPRRQRGGDQRSSFARWSNTRRPSGDRLGTVRAAGRARALPEGGHFGKVVVRVG